MSDHQEMCCDCCRYFARENPDSDVGKCVRFPPLDAAGNWPEVEESEWCGEWHVHKDHMPPIDQ